MSNQSCQNKPSITEIAWHQIRERVVKINPKLAGIIDQIKPSKKLKLFLAKYPYGVNICKEGLCFLPNNSGSLVPINDPGLPQDVKQLLYYPTTPLGLILSKSVEIYVQTPEGRTIPFKIFKPGVTFGVWETMSSPKVGLRQGWQWSISSGARHIFMLPSIADVSAHSRIRHEYGVQSFTPDNAFEHYKIFKEIINHSSTEWHTEILFFSKQWVEEQSSVGWYQLKEYWSQEAWQQIQFWASRVALNFNWEKYIAELLIRKIKLSPYLLDTIRQLVSIATGTIPGFRPIDTDETVIPSRIIEDAYLYTYGLKNYAPLLMQPDFLLPNSYIDKVYYSVQCPTLPEKPPEFKSFPSIMKMMHQIKLLMDTFREIVSQFDPKVLGSSYDFIDCIKFDYYHKEYDKMGLIKSTKELIEEDSEV